MATCKICGVDYDYAVSPCPRCGDSPGPSLRDQLAGMALQGMLADSARNHLVEPNELAMKAYMLADTMLAMRQVKR